jgi:hypothetical protein
MVRDMVFPSDENVESHDLDLLKWRPSEDTRKWRPRTRTSAGLECVIQDHSSSELSYVSCTSSRVDLSLDTKYSNWVPLQLL